MKTIKLHELKPDKFVNHKLMSVIGKVPEDSIPLLEIFRTVEGEGSYIGTPRILARVGGCAVGCTTCDTVYSWGLKDSKLVSISTFLELIDEVARPSGHIGHVREISITGGEPMHYPIQMIEIARGLHDLGYKTNLETSGVIIAPQVFQEFDMVSLDIKTPGSGVPHDQFLTEGIRSTVSHHKDVQVKAIIKTEDDLNYLELFYEDLLLREGRPLILTPCADNTHRDVTAKEINDIIQMILDWNKSYNIRIIGQQHKLLAFR